MTGCQAAVVALMSWVVLVCLEHGQTAAGEPGGKRLGKWEKHHGRCRCRVIAVRRKAAPQ